MAHQIKTVRKPKNSHHNSYRTILIVVTTLMVVSAVFAFFYLVKPFDKKSESNTTTPQGTNDIGKADDSLDPLGESAKSNEREKEKDSIAQYSGEDPNEKETITGNINFSGRSGKNVIVRATLDQNLGTSAKCLFTFTHENGQVITSESTSTTGPTTSFCGYNGDVNSLAKGKWSIRLEILTEEKQGMVTGEMEL